MKIWIAAFVVGLAAIASAHAQESEGAGQQRDFRVRPTGFMQLDFRTFPDWDVRPGTGRLNRDEIEVRRLRGGVDGSWRQLSFELSVDPFDEDGTFVKDAYLDVRLGKQLRFRSGQFKVPGSREYMTSARRLDLLERSALASQLAAGRDIGAMLRGRGRRLDYEVGLFAGDGNGRGDRSGTTAAGRVVWELFRGLEFGGYLSEGRTSAVETDAANGLDGRSSAGYRFFERLYVEGRRTRVGGDVELTHGPWRLAADAVRVVDERNGQGLDLEDLPAIVGTGASGSIAWRFGAAPASTPDASAQSRPDRWPWQVALRYELLRFDDEGAATGRDSVRPRATDVRARGYQGLTLGLSRVLNDWLRVVADSGFDRYSEPRSAPEAGRQGNYFRAGVRLQLELSSR